MKSFKLLFLALFFIPYSTTAQEERVTWTVNFENLESENPVLKIAGEIEQGWIVYGMDNGDTGPIPLELYFEEASSLIANERPVSSDLHYKYDDIFEQQVSYFEEDFTLIQPLTPTKATDSIIDFTLYYQVCSQVCINREIRFRFNRDGSEIIPLKIEDEEIRNPLFIDFRNRELLTTEVEEQTGWIIFFLGFGAGLLALLTPCVFPMIPLTVSFFYNQGSKRSRSVLLAFVYGLSIVIIYLLLSLPFHLIEGLDPSALNAISTNVSLNIFFFVVFVIFAFSFFGLFEIQLPQGLLNQMDEKANSSKYFGIFFMAVTLSLVSFSCTGPILGSLLAGSLSSAQGAWNLSFGMLGFGAALALPFTLFALFPSALNRLPKSGNWMVDVKVLLGGIELALALKFLSNADLVSHWGLLKREVFIGLWILISLSILVYFINRIRSNFKPFPIIIGLLLTLFSGYLLYGLITTNNLKLLSGFPPPDFYSILRSNESPQGLSVFHDFEEAVIAGKAQNKPILLDFTGWACVNCRKMEETVWSHPQIHNILNNELLIASLYVDDRAPLNEDEFIDIVVNGYTKEIKTIGQKWSSFQLVNFQNASQPFYVLISPDLEILSRPIQYADANQYEAWLKKSLASFKN